MDAIEFFKIAKRICSNATSCARCELSDSESRCVFYSYFIRDIQVTEIENTIHLLGLWATEHPAKTRKSEFLRLFPDSGFDLYDRILPCPKAYAVHWKCLDGHNCSVCAYDYWNEEIKE